ncbi:MAG: Sua5/YciO/YrdC/YwlC family protein [Nevskiales bacterium]|nr:Sua5/YciO/YrdC/YwlC family protein [Nevskiales bacterium]
MKPAELREFRRWFAEFDSAAWEAKIEADIAAQTSCGRINNGRMPARLYIDSACHALAAGGIIAYPTEGVWGLGCDPLNRHACARLLELKKRDGRKGLILIAADLAQLRPFMDESVMTAFPQLLDSKSGAVTWLVPASLRVPRQVSGEHDTVAVRVTAHPVASALCRAYGGPVVSTSANVAGRPPARTVLQVRRMFGPALAAVLPGELGGAGGPSTIRDLKTGTVIRP